MNEYTASNGVKVYESPRVMGAYVVSDPSSPLNTVVNRESHREALRELFRAEGDERLGRWRWPENPDYVVYAWAADPPRNDKRGVTVLSEAIPRGYTVWEDNVDTLYGTSENEEARVLARKAARAYFDAHPEPKPWHEAKEGEVWLITYDGNEYPAIFQAEAFRDHGGSWNAESISDARRIWPES